MASKQRLSKEALGHLNKVLESCGETRQYLSDCKDCGLDVEREIKTNDEQEEVARRLKQKFFPREK